MYRLYSSNKNDLLSIMAQLVNRISLIALHVINWSPHLLWQQQIINWPCLTLITIQYCGDLVKFCRFKKNWGGDTIFNFWDE